MKNKKLFAILTLVCFMFTLMPVAAFAEADTSVNSAYASTNHDFGSVIWGEYVGDVAITESFKIELYSDETLMATTVLNDVDNIFEANLQAIAWHTLLQGTVDSYWTTTWEEPHPITTVKPTHIVTYVNGENLGTTAVNFSGPDDLQPATWEEMPGVEVPKVAMIGDNYYSSLEDAVEAAENGATINILEGMHDIGALTIEKSLTLLGAGTDNTTLKVGTDGLVLTKMENITIKDMTLDGENVASEKGVINFNNGAYNNTVGTALIENCVINANSRHGIILNQGAVKDITVKNVTINESYRALYNYYCTTNIHVENSTLDGTYPFNANTENAFSLNIKDSTLKGWLSYSASTTETVTFENVTFGKGHSGYEFARPYANVNFVNCKFDTGYKIGVGANNLTYTFNNCTLGETKLTLVNLVDLMDKTETPIATLTVLLDGVDMKCVVSGSHDYVEVANSAKEPSCVEKGKKADQKCSVCGHVITGADIAATDHDYSTKTVAATCIAQGYTTHTCGNCGHIYNDNYTNAKGHSWTKDAGKSVAATADKDGIDVFTCTCGASKSETVPKLGHNFVAGVTVAPTCTEQGYTEYKCTICANHTYHGDLKDATGHTLSSKVTDPTCTNKGYTTYTCANCAYKVKSAVTDMVSHNYTTLVESEPAESDTNGWNTYKCSGCNATKTEVIPATGHNFTAKVTKAADCENDGVITYTCGDCANHSYTETIPATGHNWVKGTPIPATCTTSGYTPNTCANGCGTTRNTDLVAMKNHTFGADNKCTESGCSAVNAAALTDEEKKLEGKAVDLDENAKVSNTLNYSNAGEVQKAMEEVVEGDTSALYDISLEMNGAALTANNFPAEGYEFNIELPKNAKADTVVVSHMITETYGGNLAGDIEILPSEVRDGRVYFRTYSTSPVLLSYETTSTPEDSKPSTSTGGGGFSGTYNYPVNAGDVDGAKVSFSDNNAVAGETVTITVTPDSGKQVDEVIVTDAKGDVITVSKVGDNKYSFVMPAGKVNVTVTTEAIDYDTKVVLQINNKNVVVDGRTITNDVAPKIVGDRTLVPIRVIVEALGGTADWNEATRTVTLTIDGKVLKLVIDQPIAGFGQGAAIMDSRTYVPVRYVAEYVGANVEWIAETQQIVILK